MPNRELIESLQRRQNVAELRRRIAALHPADLAYILEALPPERRLLVWHEADPARAGAALAELSDPVGTAVAEATPRDALVAILSGMDTDDLASIADKVAPEVMEDVYRSLDASGRSWVESSITWPEGSVGMLMSPEPLLVREGWSLAQCLEEVRRRGALPRKADALFVVDARGVLRGVLAVEELLLRPPEASVREAMHAEPVAFVPEDPGGPGRGGVRALRPGVGPRGRRPRQAAGAADRRRGDGLPAPPRRAADPPAAPASAARRTSLRRPGRARATAPPGWP